ncbi:protein PALE CRESS, chloroplastic isoform X3 [Ananas comosus]|uniref:Protein PALE CRESS, chloroplastic isoform X3 n=1 Tax=Ananas comosus TaxID=4615 RepID=A0A6P5EQQ5_ANACO|nr:protein PALE CRESS, chloroplastic isoform X3 [Ananas comosus]
MAAKIACALPTLFLQSPSSSDLNPRHFQNLIPSFPQRRLKIFGLSHPLPLRVTAMRNSKEEYITGENKCSSWLPQEFYDDEWQTRQREKTKEWHAYRQKEEKEEERRTNEYREIGTRLKGYPEEEVHKARILVSSFIRSGEEIEEKIVEAAEKGELTELVLMVIWNRRDLAQRDDEKDVIRSLDLLYRRVETEILRRESTPSMRLLNDLLNLHDGFDNEGWLKDCRKHMMDIFPREEPFTSRAHRAAT